MIVLWCSLFFICMKWKLKIKKPLNRLDNEKIYLYLHQSE